MPREQHDTFDEPASRPWFGRLHHSVAAVGLGTAMATVTGLVITFSGSDAGTVLDGQSTEAADQLGVISQLTGSLAEETTPRTTPGKTPEPAPPDSAPAPDGTPSTTAGRRQVDTPRPLANPQQAAQRLPPTDAPQVAKPAPVTYTATAGPGCGGSTGFVRYGEYRDGLKGWINHGSGCGSSFVSVPMSGNAQREDPNTYTLWNFNTRPVVTGSCAISVYVPNGDLTAVGGDPTYYRVWAGGSTISTFQVRQVAQRGRWVRVGTYHVTGGRLTIQMLNTGVNWNSQGATWAHHAAATTKAECTT